MDERRSGILLGPADSELLEASEDTQHDTMQTERHADADDDDSDEYITDGRQPAEPSLRVSYVETSSQKQSQDDANVDELDRDIKTLESEIGTVTQTPESSNLDRETLDEECPTCCRQRRTSDDQRQHHDALDRRSQTVHADEEEHQTVVEQSQDCDAANHEIRTPDTARDQRRESVDREHQNVDRECQTVDEACQYDGNARQTDTETQDVHCQTTQDVTCPLSSREVQTDDSRETLATMQTEVDDATNAATTTDTNLVKVPVLNDDTLVYMHCLLTVDSIY